MYTPTNRSRSALHYRNPLNAQPSSISTSNSISIPRRTEEERTMMEVAGTEAAVEVEVEEDGDEEAPEVQV